MELYVNQYNIKLRALERCALDGAQCSWLLVDIGLVLSATYRLRFGLSIKRDGIMILRRAIVALSISAASACGFALSASYWQYDGEFATTHTVSNTKNRPMFLDINEFEELAYGHLGSGVPAA